MPNFDPIKEIRKRVLEAKNVSEVDYFTNLMYYGELVLKLISIQMVSSVKQDNRRIRYGYEHKLVRADGIGEYASTIDQILVNDFGNLFPEYVNKEANEILTKQVVGSWQYDAVEKLNSVIKDFSLPEQTLGRKTDLRRWFRDFSMLRNKTKAHGAPPSEIYVLVNSKLHESIDLIANNFYGFGNRNWCHLYQNNSGKYRVSKISESTLEFEELKYETEHRVNYSDGVYQFVGTITPVNLLSTNVELEDYFVPNGNYRKGKYEVISLITGKISKIVDSTYLVTPALLPSSDTEGFQNLNVIGESFSNIPPKLPNYIDRTEVEEDLRKVLMDSSRFPVVTVKGKGGIGKTSTTIEVIHSLGSNLPYSYVIWFSSRDVDLHLDGPKAVTANIFSNQDIADYCVELFEVSGLKSVERLAWFQNVLEKGYESDNILFVFDNFETIHDPLEVYNWLWDFVRSPNKVLITSRESRDFKADFPIPIKAMKVAEALKLINQTATNLGITNILTEKYIEDLISKSGRHPYVMKILLGEVKKNGKLSPIDRIVANREDILTALFYRAYNQLSKGAQRIFLTLCSWKSLVAEISIYAVFLRPSLVENFEVETILNELITLSLVDTYTSEDGDVFMDVPLAASLFGKSELKVHPERLAIIADRDLLIEFGVTNENQISAGIGPRISNKFKEVGDYILKNRDESANYLKKHIAVLEYLCTKYPEAYRYLADLYDMTGNEEGIIRSLRDFIKSQPINEDIKRTWRQLASIYDVRGDDLKVCTSLAEIVVLRDTTLDETSDIVNTINGKLSGLKEVDRIERTALVQSLIKVFSSRIIDSRNASDYSRLAWLYLYIKDTESAKTIVEQGLDIDPLNQYCMDLEMKLNRY